jgi:hypothetical protein
LGSRVYRSLSRTLAREREWGRSESRHAGGHRRHQ